MEAKLFEIESKAKNFDLDIAKLSDFQCSAGVTVDARAILEHPQTTLYCLDDAHRQAVFVQSPPERDLSQRPFYFIEQYKHAQRVLTVSYETLHELAGLAGARYRRVIPMHSVGRCGGTLVSRAMNRLDNVFSLDEPDVYTNIALLRPDDGSRDAEMVALLRSATQLLFRPMKPGADTLFLKLRPFAIKAADLIYQAFPDTKALFLYRNADTWARSVGRSVQALIEAMPADAENDSSVAMMRMMDLFGAASQRPAAASKNGRSASGQKSNSSGHHGVPPALIPFFKKNVLKQMARGDKRKLLWLVIAERVPFLRGRNQSPQEFLMPHLLKVPPMKILTLLWAMNLQRYLKLRADGLPIMALKYETLVAEPEGVLRALFQYWDLPADQTAQAMGAFAEDAQKGTPLSRELVGSATRPGLDPAWLAQMREVLRDFAEIQEPDVVLAGSVPVAQASHSAG